MEWTWILLSTGGASCEWKTAVCCFNRYEWADRQSPPFSALAVKIDRSLRIWASTERRGGRVVAVMVWPRRRVLHDTPGVTHNRCVASHESVIHTWHNTTPCYRSATGTLSLFGRWDGGAWWMTPRKTSRSVDLLMLWLIAGAMTACNRLMKVLSLLKINSGGVVLWWHHVLEEQLCFLRVTSAAHSWTP